MGNRALRVIFNMVCKINNNCKDTDPLVIFNYSGHTKGVYVTIFENGYVHHVGESKEYHFYIDDDMFNKDDYLELLDALSEILPEDQE